MNTKSVAQNKRLFKISLLAIGALVFAGCKAADPKVKKIKDLPSFGSNVKTSNKMITSLAGGNVSPDGGTTKIKFTISIGPTSDVKALGGSGFIRPTNAGVAHAQ